MLCFTGFRRGDVVVGRQHIRTIVDPKTEQTTKIISLRTEKGQDEIEVTIPLLPILERTLEAGPAGGLAFICGENGRPLKNERKRETCAYPHPLWSPSPPPSRGVIIGEFRGATPGA